MGANFSSSFKEKSRIPLSPPCNKKSKKRRKRKTKKKNNSIHSSSTSASHVEDEPSAAASHAGGTSLVTTNHTRNSSSTSASHVEDEPSTAACHAGGTSLVTASHISKESLTSASHVQDSLQITVVMLAEWRLIRNLGIEVLNLSSLIRYARETILLIYALVFQRYKGYGLSLKVLLLLDLIWFLINPINHWLIMW